MRNGARFIVAAVVIGAFAVLAVVRYLPTDYNIPTTVPTGFNPQGRYDPTRLNDMGVIYLNRSDIRSFHEAWSTSNSCPWGFAHNGIDFDFKNDTTVIAAAPGQVERIDLMDFGADKENRYTVNLGIRFNATVLITYGFEPWTNQTAGRAQQVVMFKVAIGTWVAKGDPIASFLMVGVSAHIHFGVIQDNIFRDPSLYISSGAIVELLAMVQSFHPTWLISYP
jgi:murein DD-endopeptidase MepM/ murein hydrolase activator NlpD